MISIRIDNPSTDAKINATPSSTSTENHQGVVIHIADKKPDAQPTQTSASTQPPQAEEMSIVSTVEFKPTTLETVDTREKIILPVKTLSDSIAHGLGVSYGFLIMVVDIMDKSNSSSQDQQSNLASSVNLFMLGVTVLFAVVKAYTTYKEDSKSRTDLITSLSDERTQLVIEKNNLEHQKILVMTNIFKCFAEFQQNYYHTENKEIRSLGREFINTMIDVLKKEKIIKHDVDHEKLKSILANMYKTIKMNSQNEYVTDDIHAYLRKNNDWQEKLLENPEVEAPAKSFSLATIIQYLADTAASNYSNVFSAGGLAVGFGASTALTVSFCLASALVLQRGINYQNARKKAREDKLEAYRADRIATEETAFKLASSEEDFDTRSKQFLAEARKSKENFGRLFSAQGSITPQSNTTAASIAEVTTNPSEQRQSDRIKF